jgi:hypothetical protein
MMYHSIASKLTEDRRVELDALLGDLDAVESLRERNVENMQAAGWKVMS